MVTAAYSILIRKDAFEQLHFERLHFEQMLFEQLLSNKQCAAHCNDNYNYRRQGRNQEFITGGGARPGTGGAQFTQQRLCKKISENVYKIGTIIQNFYKKLLIKIKQILRQSEKFLLIFNHICKITTDQIKILKISKKLYQI